MWDGLRNYAELETALCSRGGVYCKVWPHIHLGVPAVKQRRGIHFGRANSSENSKAICDSVLEETSTITITFSHCFY